MQITKGQHFVWGRYLENWSVNGKVFVKDIKRNISRSSSTGNILLENYMYELPTLNQMELERLNEFIKGLNFIDSEVDKVFLSLVSMASTLSKKGQLSDNSSSPRSSDFIRKTIKEGFEPFYSKTESFGQELISIVNPKDLIVLLRTDYLKITLFVLIQYLRTQNMRDNFLKLKHNDSEPLLKAKSLLTPILLAYDIWIKKTPSFKILINLGSDSFFTSDQPIINVATSTDFNGNYLDFILYYPINPKLAIEVSFSNDEMYIESESCSYSVVQWYNKNMSENNIIISDKSI